MSTFSFGQSQGHAFVQSRALARGHRANNPGGGVVRSIFCFRTTNYIGQLNTLNGSFSGGLSVPGQIFGRGGSIFRKIEYTLNPDPPGSVLDLFCSVDKNNFPTAGTGPGNTDPYAVPFWSNNPRTIALSTVPSPLIGFTVTQASASSLSAVSGFGQTIHFTLSNQVSAVSFLSDLKSAINSYSIQNPTSQSVVWLSFKDVPYPPLVDIGTMSLADLSAISPSQYDGSVIVVPSPQGATPGNLSGIGTNNTFLIVPPGVANPSNYPGPNSFWAYGLVNDGQSQGQGGAVACQTTVLVNQKYVMVTWLIRSDAQGITAINPSASEAGAPAIPTLITIPIPQFTEFAPNQPYVGYVTRLLQGYDVASWTAAGKPF